MLLMSWMWSTDGGMQIFGKTLRVLVTQIHTKLKQLSFSVEHAITFELALAPS